MSVAASNYSDNSEPIRIGISSCLLGRKVRFDGGHKQDNFATGLLSRFVAFVPLCPEIEVGMGVPREAIRLEGDPINPRLVGNRSGEDWTQRMRVFSGKALESKKMQGLSGFILKSKSPTCGMERVRVYAKTGMAQRSGTGVFAAEIMRTFPDLPVEEEGRLLDASLRENFIERVFAYHRLQQLYAEAFSRNKMIDFHRRHKYQVLAHNPEYYRRLGQLTAGIKEYNPSVFRNEYRTLFMQALRYKATTSKNTNVLQHVAGFLKKHLTPGEKSDVQQAIDDYRHSLIPLVVPVTLLRHFVHKHSIEYIRDQYYLNPHPKELMLRNHV